MASASAARRIAGYEVERELARGGMGVVHLAVQPALERRAVLKALRRDLADHPDLEERFLREARAAARVHHPNVVGVYDCFVWRGERFIAQELVDGPDLAEVLGKVERLPVRIAGLVALELVRGLEEIHACAVVHRDLKPSNVLLGRGGETKIADFGIAFDPADTTLTRTGHALGTPSYMAPEQHRGERADGRSDLFAWGAIVYEMLAGQRPFAPLPDSEDAASSLLAQVERGRHAPLRRVAPETPGWLARLVHACLRARPARRPATAAGVRRTLERRLGAPAPADCRAEIADWLWERGVVEAEEGTRRQVSAAPRRRRRPVQRWAAVAALSLALGTAVGAAGLWLSGDGAAVLPALVVNLRGAIGW